ncbi:MAG: glycosyltransferase family 2 protein, partial [Hyphomicrobiales bacterium]
FKDTKAKLEDTDRALNSLRHEAQALNAELMRTNYALEIGQNLLNTARRKPLRMLCRYVLHKLLKGLSKCSPPLPVRMTAWFRRSADKRNPRKSILDNASEPLYDYQNWIDSVESLELLSPEAQQKLQLSLSDGPIFSVVIPVYNPDPALLKLCIQSVLEQTYDRFEVCIADDSSSDPGVLQVLDDFAASDARVKLVKRKTNGHISAASNSALELATGDYIALLNHDDLLPPHALLYMARAIAETPEAKIFYSDEDLIDIDGTRESPHFKPDFNRDLLYSVNYISHFGVYERDMVSAVGGFREGFEGAQDYDLVLRCVACISEDEVVHVPHILYHWRKSENIAAADISNKDYAHKAGMRALNEHLNQTGYATAAVISGPKPTMYRVNWPTPKDPPRVSILIPTRDHKDMVKQAVDSILAQTNYPNYEIVILDNHSTELETLAWFSEISSVDQRVRILTYPHPFNYSAINNFGVENSDGTYICLVNNDVEVISPEWLEEMVSLAERPNAGCVGAKLFYPNDKVQHAGVFIGIGGVAGHSHKHFPRSNPGHHGRLLHRQTITAVTGACLLVSRDIYNEVGGLDAEHLTVAFNDIDFCLKVHAAGYHNVWTPFAELYHHESISRGPDHIDAEKIKRFEIEKLYMRDRWNTHTYKDRHYNPNLTLDREDFGFRRS